MSPAARGVHSLVVYLVVVFVLVSQCSISFALVLHSCLLRLAPLRRRLREVRLYLMIVNIVLH